MKKVLITLVFLLLLISPSLSAIEIEMKDTFGQEEILMAKIVGDLTKPPLRENIFIYRGHVRTATDAYVTKINEDYYIYASLAGKEPRNYSFVIEGVEYTKGTRTISEDIVRNFTVTAEFVVFTVLPGFVVTKEGFTLTLENFQDTEIEVVMNISTLSGNLGGISNYGEGSDHYISLKPGTDKIKFELDYLESPTEKLITFLFENLTYSVPVSLYIDEHSLQSKVFAFDIEPSEIEMVLPTHSNKTTFIYIYNTGSGTLTDIRLKLSDSLSPYVTISEKSFGQIVSESNAHFELRVVSGSEKSIGGKLEVETEQGLLNEMRISIAFEEGYQPTPEEEAPQIRTEETCQDKKLPMCVKDKETCDGDIVLAKNGVCCVGTCKAIPSGTSLKIIGWIIFIVIILGGVWFYFKKYKGVKKPLDLLKIAQGKKSSQ